MGWRGNIHIVLLWPWVRFREGYPEFVDWLRMGFEVNMIDLARYRLDFEPDRQLGDENQPPKDWRRHDQLITAVAAKVMEPDQTNLKTLLDGHVFRIPEYQRTYSWNEENWEPLWRDIIEIKHAQIGVGVKAHDLFFGMLFVAESDSPGVNFDVIDGQQRLTTIGLIIRALVACMELISDREIEEESCRHYKKVFLLRADAYLFRDFGEFSSERSPRIVLDARNRREYSLIMASDATRGQLLQKFQKVHHNARRNALRATQVLNLLGGGFEVPPEVPQNLHVPETSKLLLRGYDYFVKRIEEELVGLTADGRVRLLANVLDYIMNSLSITVFKISREHPRLLMSVFEVLNNRGLELALTDVINARIVQRLSSMAAPDGTSLLVKWRRTADYFGGHTESIRDFLVDYLTSQYPEKGSRAFHSERLLEAFSFTMPADDARVHEKPLLLDEVSAREVIDNLRDAAPLYAFLLDPDAEGREFGDRRLGEQVRDSVRRLQALQTRQWRAYVMTVGLAVEAEATGENARWLVNTVDTIERLAIRQSICGVNPNRLEEVFRKAIQRFNDGGFASVTPAVLWEDFEAEYGSAVGAERFVEAFVRKEDWGNNAAKVVLWRAFALAHAEDEMVFRQLNAARIHLEHVMPQAPYIEGKAVQPWLDGVFSFDERYTELKSEIRKDEEKRQAFLEDVVALLVRDMGNTILLKDNVNKSIQNKSFAWKLAAYEATQGFDEIVVNAPLSNWDWGDGEDVRERIARYLDLREGRLEGEAGGRGSRNAQEAALLEEIEADPKKMKIDRMWNATLLGTRRADIIGNALSGLAMPGEDLNRVFRAEDAQAVIQTRIESIIEKYSGV